MGLRKLVALGLVALVALPAWADPPNGYPFHTYDEGLQRAAAEQKPVFLYFGRYGCGWCDKTNKESFADAGVKKRFTENYVLVYVDAESGDRITLPNGERITEMELGARMNVFATPVFAWLDADGRTLLKVPGYKSAEEFLQFDDYVRGGHYREQSLLQYLRSRS
ncbi:MAG: thioredoxin fold domain-containing protein [Thiohalomonadaceae bacterium]